MDELSILKARVTVLEQQVEELCKLLITPNLSVWNAAGDEALANIEGAQTLDDMEWDYNMATFGVGDPLEEEYDEME